MKIAGIVAEYNPFHNGHLYQITQTKKETGCDYIVVVMSGNFSQRGSATLCHKFTRTKMALLNGADLVLELPVPFATASAETFAQYSVCSLHATHMVDYLSFGSELGDLGPLTKIASLLSNTSPLFTSQLRSYLKEGLSFPRAREKALIDELTDEGADLNHYLLALQSPNNILGIEYLKALTKLNSSIQPFTVSRIGTGYHDEHLTHKIASATAIRKQVANGQTDYLKCVPTNLHSLLSSETLVSMDRLMPFLHFKLMFSKTEDLYALWDLPKPLLHSLIKACHPTITYDELVDAVTSKTYTRATVARSLLRILLNLRKETLEPVLNSGMVPYLRVLGCRKDATKLLKLLMQNSSVPVITNFAKQYNTLDPSIRTFLDYEIEATKLYHYMHAHAMLMNQDFTTPFLLV